MRRDELDPATPPCSHEIAEHRQQFLEAMDDDFNTGGALGELFEIVHALNRFANEPSATAGRVPPASTRRGMVVLKELSQILGLFRPAAGPAPGQRRRPDRRPCSSSCSSSAPGSARRRTSRWPTRFASGSTELGVTLEDRPDGTRLADRAATVDRRSFLPVEARSDAQDGPPTV